MMSRKNPTDETEKDNEGSVGAELGVWQGNSSKVFKTCKACAFSRQLVF